MPLETPNAAVLRRSQLNINTRILDAHILGGLEQLSGGMNQASAPFPR